ncbi:MAG TPA: hypothetical protein DHV93_01175 [Holophagaceae bacterium]|nr:hypothetical protein [Holophagaceae bacterium]
MGRHHGAHRDGPGAPGGHPAVQPPGECLCHLRHPGLHPALPGLRRRGSGAGRGGAGTEGLSVAAIVDPAQFRLVIPSQTRYLNLVTGLAKRASLVAGLDDAAAAKVSIAVDEAVTNVILHAYHGEGEHSVELELRFTEEALEIHILHSGQGFRSDQVVLPDPKEYIKHPRKGGLGLLLMSRFMDEVQFKADEASGRNECCLIKKLD